MTEPKRCGHCKGQHLSDLEAARCAHAHAIVADLLAAAGRLDDAPSVVQVRDLWSHARDLRDDGAAAAIWVRKVLELGWRPKVGST